MRKSTRTELTEARQWNLALGLLCGLLTVALAVSVTLNLTA